MVLGFVLGRGEATGGVGDGDGLQLLRTSRVVFRCLSFFPCRTGVAGRGGGDCALWEFMYDSRHVDSLCDDFHFETTLSLRSCHEMSFSLPLSRFHVCPFLRSVERSFRFVYATVLALALLTPHSAPSLNISRFHRRVWYLERSLQSTTSLRCAWTEERIRCLWLLRAGLGCASYIHVA